MIASCALVVLLALSGNKGDVQTPRVEMGGGVVQGSVMTSRRGYDIYAFRGIRYAEPPVGPLRFKAPRDVTQYEGLVDARDNGPSCPQPAFDFFTTSEDCLRINVYSRDLSPKEPLPVLVFIHPGGFYSLSGESNLYGPQYFLDRAMVLVTINYRLGSLGFISTGDQHAPGNNGLKDQVSALRWVKRNIKAFGGDPDSVTISGYSAGSFSVILHMLSPMSKGLFHGGIAMSGSPVAQWPVPPHQLKLAKKQAQLVGCPHSSSEEIIACLRDKSAQELGDSLNGFGEFNGDPVLQWREVVEPGGGGEGSEEAFLSEQPAELIRSRRFSNDVPLILGVCELEFAGRAFAVIANDTLRNQLSSEWERIAPIAFLYEEESWLHSKHISRGLYDAFVKEKGSKEGGKGRRRKGPDRHHGYPLEYTNRTSFGLGQIYGDSLISFGVHRASRLLSEYLRSPVYYYKFNYTGDVSHYYYPNTTTPIGAVHHDDLIYLFQSTVFPRIDLSSPHSRNVDRMTTLWTNFMYRRDPNPKTASEKALLGTKWPVLRPKSRHYLQINQHDEEVRDCMNEDRFAVWQRLFPWAFES